MKKIYFEENKILKLINVISMDFNLAEEEGLLNTRIEQMESYIKAKGNIQIGPFIQYTRPFMNENNEVELKITLMLQCKNLIHTVEKPYKMQSLLRIKDCLYCRYHGPENKLKFAYDKINLEAFEKDIDLAGENYTIFVDENEENETITADVFMPKAE